ncbi:hypothetical protein ES319_D13G203500v1 [Gossypium barbadense]|uniref:Methyltransferase n=2 Tax=Gossypium TaxID=3633 RepID=A0A5J5NPC1_GOSBA|nr:hypothetical protein ES319_D13G203500v1 [Gossypium barbadense]PPD99977.1 hypothetical protein GOBAR_DD02958 [Gossypium barbadense]TYG38356.1 hypothetical protein ES288_D13G216000v1 [Gossypium darwinii]
MCPLRFLLVFLSAVLAGYVTWRTAHSSSNIDDDGGGNGNVVSEDSGKIVAIEKQEISSKRKVQNAFWVFVDMASGKYLSRNFKNSE